jgi:hypothetical protein
MDFLDSVVTTTLGGIQQQHKQSPAEKQLRPMLVDDSIQVLSTFELNQVASLTFNDVTCDDIFELIETICRRPSEYTPITIQKALVVTKHVLIFGQDKCINHGYGLIEYFKYLAVNFNTVLLAQKQGGALAFFQSLQGGGVDKGGPVREVATQLVKLLSNIPELQRLRNANASNESLVPIGDDKVAFVTDEVRHQILKNRIEAERQIQIKSNLAKAENGFGAGYGSRDGKSVVGAAHGIEEMIKMANLQKKKFTDDQDTTKPPGYKSEEEIILEELRAEAEAAKKAAAARQQQQQQQQQSDFDLLGFNNNTSTPASQQEGDLLGFGDTTTTNTTTSSASNTGIGDLLGTGGGLGMAIPTSYTSPLATDPFGLSSLSVPITNQGSTLYNNHNPATATDPFASVGLSTNTATIPIPSTMNTVINSNIDSGLVSLSMGMASMGLGTGGGGGGTSVMSSGEDRFAALDALALNTNNIPSLPSTNFNSAMNAEDRIRGGIGSTSATTTAAGMSWPSIPQSNQHMAVPGGGLHVAKAYGNPGDDGDNPWVMGGSAGTGLQPLAPAPGAPPPPPPPTF